MPAYVATDNITEGMILAEDIKNKQGILMLSKGLLLGERHKKVLKTWFITGVLIESLEDNVDLPPEIVSAAKTQLESYMDWECTIPIEKDLFESSVIKLAKELAKNERSGTE
jgi:hypothetical protein